MVRLGEYSPRNTNLVSLDKPLLGLGEYEERRRQILDQKKREYKEQLEQKKKEYKIRSGTMPRVEISSFEMANSSNAPDDTLKKNVSQELHSSEFVDMSSQAMNQDIGVVSSKNNKVSHPSETDSWSANITHSTNRITQELSPHEKKVIELYKSNFYSPSFPNEHNTQMESPSSVKMSPQLNLERQRRLAYQAELERQIREKKLREAEEKEKERREDEALVRLWKEEEERIRKEEERQEAQRKERELLRQQQALLHEIRLEELRQEALKERSRRMRSRRENAGKNSSAESSGKEDRYIPSGRHHINLPEEIHISDLEISSRNEENINSSDTKGTGSDVNGTAMIATGSDTNGARTSSQHISPVHKKSMSKILDQIDSYESPKEITELLRTGLPMLEKNSNKLIPNSRGSDKRDLLQHSIGTITNNIRKSYDLQRLLPIPNADFESDCEWDELPHYRNKEGSSVLSDSLPIPVMKAESPVPAVRLKTLGLRNIPPELKLQPSIQNSEAKWKVPAVQKNILKSTNPDAKKVLTQLGTFRKQMQVDQMRMEEMLLLQKSRDNNLQFTKDNE